MFETKSYDEILCNSFIKCQRQRCKIAEYFIKHFILKIFPKFVILRTQSLSNVEMLHRQQLSVDHWRGRTCPSNIFSSNILLIWALI